MKTLKEILESILTGQNTTMIKGDAVANELTSFGAYYELIGWENKNTKKSSCISIPKLKRLTTNASKASFNRYHHFYQEYEELLTLWLENLNMVEIGFTDKDLSDKSNWEEFKNVVTKLMMENKITKGREGCKIIFSDHQNCFRVRFAVTADLFPKYFDLEYKKR